MFRRPRFRLIRRQPENEMPPVLENADHLMSTGRFSEAAELFEDLAHGAQAHGYSRDAQFFLAAAHCRIQARQIDPAMLDLKQGLGILSSRRKFVRFQHACLRSIEELKSAGFITESLEISKLLDSMAQIFPSNIQQQPNVSLRQFPANCASCGGVLRSDEVDQIDEYTVECPWCGSVIRCE